MQIQAKIIVDSKNEFNNRITTFILTYPRIIHAEFMTHRMFSRNAASSRAVPAEKLIKAVEETPFIPLAFQRNHKGMQGVEYITDSKEIEFEIQDWLDDRDYVVKKAKARLKRGVTKQLVNRPLETFQWYTCIVTATEWENFFALRCPEYHWSGVINESLTIVKKFRSWKDLINYDRQQENPNNYEEWINPIAKLSINKGQAEIHMMALAEAMWDAYNESTPKQLKAGEWHTPFGDNIFMSILDQQEIAHKFPSINSKEELKIRIATARCARVSYTVVGEEGKPDNYENDIKLHDRLLASGHASPLEHCAQAMDNTNRSRNFLGGWKQYREILGL